MTGTQAAERVCRYREKEDEERERRERERERAIDDSRRTQESAALGIRSPALAFRTYRNYLRAEGAGLHVGCSEASNNAREHAADKAIKYAPI